jgi:MYXO-CTERM domain-containing protein
MFGAPLVPPMSHVTSVDPARALPNLLAPFALAGLVALALRRRWAAALVGGWIVAAGGAVVLQAYPFSGRLALYALPVTCAVSAAWVCIPRTRVGRAAAVAVFAAVALPLPAWMAITVARSPTEREEIHQVVMRLGAELEPGDVVYLYGRGWRQFEVYKRLGLPPVWAQATVVEASKAVVASAEPGAEWNVDERGRREVAIATSDLRRLAAGPQRVWAVFSHYMDTTDERRAVLGQLAPDHRVVKSIEATGAAADLID